jgi:fatty-acyl-CoA synthase
MIITGGENVIPAEVEDVLIQHPGIVEAAVVGLPDPEWQQAVTAVVVVREGEEVDLDEVRSHCEGKLAPYKVPKRVEVVEELPRTPSGKLHRAGLRDPERFARGLSPEI